jgi:hypothetical protein
MVPIARHRPAGADIKKGPALRAGPADRRIG